MFTIENTKDGIRLNWNNKHILSYNFQTGGPRSYWHPLRLPDSPVLTMDRPGDHIHHQGMWVAWKSINGINFWEQPGSEADPTGYGRILHKKLLECQADEKTAHFTTQNHWVDWQDKIHLNEIRKTVIYAPEEKYLKIDVSIHFLPVGRDAILDLKRGEPGGGGLFYSGLTIRFDNALTPGQMLDANGRTETMKIYGGRSQWCGFAGKHKTDGKVYGITIIDHPDNPRHPTPWWVRNAENYALLQPCLCYNEPYNLAQEESLKLKYKIILHKDHVDPELINSLR